MSEPGTIHVDQFLPHPPERVWRVLTEPDLLARWLMPSDFAPEVGHRFSFRTDPVPATGFDGVVHCEVLDLVPGQRLRISWRSGAAFASTVTWTLVPEGAGTRLLLEHAGFDVDDPEQLLALRIMGGGWRSRMPRRLAALLDELSDERSDERSSSAR